jgi:hypothetical protein
MTTISTDGTGLSREIRSRACNCDNIRALIADQLGVDIKVFLIKRISRVIWEWLA